MKCDRDIELYVRDEIDLDELEERMDVALGIRRSRKAARKARIARRGAGFDVWNQATNLEMAGRSLNFPK
jgi:hypothetical protein